MHGQELFKGEIGEEKKGESVVDRLFYRKKKEKVDLNFIAFGKFLPQR